MARCVFLTERTIDSVSSGCSERASTTSQSTTELAELVGCLYGLMHHAAPADDRQVAALTHHAGLPDGSRVTHLRYGSAQAKQSFQHNHNYWIVVAGRANNETLGVTGASQA